MVIRQGDVYWLDLGEPVGSAPGYRHPHVVIQNDAANLSRIETMSLLEGGVDPIVYSFRGLGENYSRGAQVHFAVDGLRMSSRAPL